MNIKLVIAFIYLFISLSLSDKAIDTNSLLTIQPKNQSSWNKVKNLFFEIERI